MLFTNFTCHERFDDFLPPWSRFTVRHFPEFSLICLLCEGFVPPAGHPPQTSLQPIKQSPSPHHIFCAPPLYVGRYVIIFPFLVPVCKCRLKVPESMVSSRSRYDLPFCFFVPPPTLFLSPSPRHFRPPLSLFLDVVHPYIPAINIRISKTVRLSTRIVARSAPDLIKFSHFQRASREDTLPFRENTFS